LKCKTAGLAQERLGRLYLGTGDRLNTDFEKE
jgi:hypothetical protein